MSLEEELTYVDDAELRHGDLAVSRVSVQLTGTPDSVHAGSNLISTDRHRRKRRDMVDDRRTDDDYDDDGGRENVGDRRG